MNYREEYSKYIELPEGNGPELMVLCPFHSDSKPSCSINIETGQWYCFSGTCRGRSGGGIITFVSLIEGISQAEAKLRVFPDGAGDPNIKAAKGKAVAPLNVSDSDIAEWNAALLANQEMLDKLNSKCGWTTDSVHRFELGYHDGRITIPIRAINGTLVNVRKYKLECGPDEAKVMGIPGHNQAVIWPATNLQNERVFLMEGEKDCILANQLGLPAVTSTGGCGHFPTNWVEYFSGKRVVVMYDIDEAGRSGAQKVVNMLKSVVHDIKNYRVPITSPANGDFTDYIIQGGTVQHIVEELNVIPSADIERFSLTLPDEVVDTTLHQAIYNNMCYQRVRMKVRVMGCVNTPYLIPKKVRITCNKTMNKLCLGCQNYNMVGEQRVVIDEKNVELLNLIECTDSKQRLSLTKIAGIPSKCYMHNFHFDAHQFVEEVFVVPTLDEQGEMQDYQMRSIYMFDIKISTNQDYHIEAIAVKHPNTQALTFISYKADPCESSVEEFVMTPEIKEKLLIWTLDQNLITSMKTSNTTLQRSMPDDTPTLPST